MGQGVDATEKVDRGLETRKTPDGATFIAGFLLHHVAFYTALRLWRRDFRALRAIYRGLGEGLSTPLRAPVNDLAPNPGKANVQGA